MTITKIQIAPYVRGPEVNPQPVKAPSQDTWMRALMLLMGKVFRSDLDSGERPAADAPPVAKTHWAYRAVNYRRLRSAGMPCVVAAPPIAAGVSSHLELEAIAPSELREGDVFLVETDQTIFADGTILEGMAMIDESAISGQSALVFRAPDGEAAAMRDSRVIAGQILVEVAARRGHPLDWIDSSTRDADSHAATAASR